MTDPTEVQPYATAIGWANPRLEPLTVDALIDLLQHVDNKMLPVTILRRRRRRRGRQHASVRLYWGALAGSPVRDFATAAAPRLTGADQTRRTRWAGLEHARE